MHVVSKAKVVDEDSENPEGKISTQLRGFAPGVVILTEKICVVSRRRFCAAAQCLRYDVLAFLYMWEMLGKPEFGKALRDAA